MDLSSFGSNISYAEEIIDDIFAEDKPKVNVNENVYLDNNIKSEIEMNISHSAIGNSGRSIGYGDDDENERMSSSSIYSPIQPEHVRIMDLHVDPDLKPDYILSSKDSVWLGRDRSTEENRRKGIIRYLSSGKDVSNEGNESIMRALSYDNLRGIHRQLLGSRRGSLDDTGLGKRALSRDKALKKDGVGEGLSLHGNDESTDDNEAGSVDNGGGNIVEALEFQTSLKNERYHFIFSDILMESIEILSAEEHFYRNRHEDINRSNLTRSTVESESDNGTSSHIAANTATTFSKAETTSLAFIDDILTLLDQLIVSDDRRRSLPEQLQSLLGRLEKRSLLSLSFDLVSKSRISGTRDSVTMSECECNVTESIIKAAIGSVTLSFPVGGSAILGPDMSLPSYVVSRLSSPAKRSATLSLQHNTCPGCHKVFMPDVARRLRFCSYYCHYFCSVCHSNTLMLIPARILSKWDFSMLPVSRPARDLLQLIHTVPLFTVAHFSASLRSSLRVLASVCRLRRQARLLLNFIEICRQASHLTALLATLPRHWFSEPPSLFSIADLCLMDTGHMEPHMRRLVSQYIEHVSLCPVCQARGFFCELLHCDSRSQIIFPFEIDLVGQCAQCCACFHLRCYNKARDKACPRCARRRLRDQGLKLSVTS